MEQQEHLQKREKGARSILKVASRWLMVVNIPYVIWIIIAGSIQWGGKENVSYMEHSAEVLGAYLLLSTLLYLRCERNKIWYASVAYASATFMGVVHIGLEVYLSAILAVVSFIIAKRVQAGGAILAGVLSSYWMVALISGEFIKGDTLQKVANLFGQSGFENTFHKAWIVIPVAVLMTFFINNGGFKWRIKETTKGTSEISHKKDSEQTEQVSGKTFFEKTNIEKEDSIMKLIKEKVKQWL